MLVETVTKTAKVAGAYSASSSSSSTTLTSDASKVVCRGTGLSKALVGQKNNFTVDCSKAGESIPKIQKEKIKPLFLQTPQSRFERLLHCGWDELLKKARAASMSSKQGTKLTFVCSLVSGKRFRASQFITRVAQITVFVFFCPEHNADREISASQSHVSWTSKLHKLCNFCHTATALSTHGNPEKGVITTLRVYHVVAHPALQIEKFIQSFFF